MDCEQDGHLTTPRREPGIWRRPLRAGLVTLCSVSAFWLVVHVLFIGTQCDSSYAQQYGCLGGEMIVAAIGALSLLIVVALALSGRGPSHSMQGALVSLGAGWLSVSGIFTWLDVADSDFLGQMLTAPAAAIAAALWAARGPGTPEAKGSWE